MRVQTHAGWAEAETVQEVINLLAPHFGPPNRATMRAIGPDEVERAYRELPNAERRVRVYSNQGFVPTRHGHRCDIQFVQVDRYGDEWVWTVQWGSARRSYGHGSLVVVR